MVGSTIFARFTHFKYPFQCVLHHPADLRSLVEQKLRNKSVKSIFKKSILIPFPKPFKISKLVAIAVIAGLKLNNHEVIGKIANSWNWD